jgi:hypothetical protein
VTPSLLTAGGPAGVTAEVAPAQDAAQRAGEYQVGGFGTGEVGQVITQLGDDRRRNPDGPESRVRLRRPEHELSSQLDALAADHHGTGLQVDISPAQRDGLTPACGQASMIRNPSSSLGDSMIEARCLLSCWLIE